ncbi:hypothetical protein AAE478_002926 [Parahypoxylon ruwenzoriense]
MSRNSSDSTATEKSPDAPDINSRMSTPLPDHVTAADASSTMPATPQHDRARVHYNKNADTPFGPRSAARLSPIPPSLRLRRHTSRSNTFRTVEEFENYENQPPGAEPGIDPSLPDGGQDTIPKLHADCHITVVDFSQDNLQIHELNNAELTEFVKRPQPDWVKCRWINVNGLSWDVIQALGQYKDLHRLAVEDLMNTRNRTKADWLVRMTEDDSSDDDSSDDENSDAASVAEKFRGWFSRKKVRHPTSASVLESGRKPPLMARHSFSHEPTTSYSKVFNPNTLCTLQRFQAPPSTARTEYMERHSALGPKGMAVAAEQVSMFLTSDNTVIAFFEQSANDVEKPILARLGSPTTILRQSCDASMVAQAIIDAIIDMAIPVTARYSGLLGDLELNVLTKPSVQDTKNLYIMISEINKIFSFVNPIQTLINSLRDHKTNLTQEDATRELQNPLGGVIISPMTCTYLGDVYDHCVLIIENLNQSKESASHLIDLIFNTIATNQNESTGQLTMVTTVFLPMTFLTGYFGQNFQDFEPTKGSVTYFWQIAVPVVIGMFLIIMRGAIFERLGRIFQRRRAIGIRKRQEAKTKNRKHQTRKTA